MEALAILVLGAVVVVALWSWLAGGSPDRRDAGSGPLGLRSAGEILEGREALEAEDLAQLLEACNERRRRRGERERTLEDVELQLVRDRQDTARPGAARTDTTRPGMARPDTTRPDMAGPSAARPGR